MELTWQKALELHREMWQAMKDVYGDNPNVFQRKEFKKKWCEEHFPQEEIAWNCFLCEYAKEPPYINCTKCPIVWGESETDDVCFCKNWRNTQYLYAPISEILALPERGTDYVPHVPEQGDVYTSQKSGSNIVIMYFDRDMDYVTYISSGDIETVARESFKKYFVFADRNIDISELIKTLNEKGSSE